MIKNNMNKPDAPTSDSKEINCTHIIPHLRKDDKEWLISTKAKFISFMYAESF